MSPAPCRRLDLEQGPPERLSVPGTLQVPPPTGGLCSIQAGMPCPCWPLTCLGHHRPDVTWHSPPSSPSPYHLRDSLPACAFISKHLAFRGGVGVAGAEPCGQWWGELETDTCPRQPPPRPRRALSPLQRRSPRRPGGAWGVAVTLPPACKGAWGAALPILDCVCAAVNRPGEPEPPGAEAGAQRKLWACSRNYLRRPAQMPAGRGGSERGCDWPKATQPQLRPSAGLPWPPCAHVTHKPHALSQGRRTSGTARGTGPWSRMALVPARGGAAALPLSPPSLG